MKIRKDHVLRLLGYVLIGYLLTFSHGFSDLEQPIFRTVSASESSQDLELSSPAQIYAVSPNILAVEVAAPEVLAGTPEPYSPLPEDAVTVKRSRRQVVRSGVPIGTLVGDTQTVLYPYDQVAETSFKVDRADSLRSYQVSCLSDTNYVNARSPIQVFRKSKPVNFSRRPNGERLWPTAHTLFLVLPHSMDEGKTYQLSFPDLGLAPASFAYKSLGSRSEAVHVSQIGFHPQDSVKVGYLSTWLGNGGGLDYPDSLPFHVVDVRTNESVYESLANLRRGVTQLEDARNRDYTLTEVHQLDFSDFNQPGRYRLCVNGVGCSFEFEISRSVWQNAFFTAVRGFYHQRSGIEIGPPYSQYRRPRAFHPDDGLAVYQSTAKMTDVRMGLGDRNAFEALMEGKTDEVVPDAWGGYFDAGDWDRRTYHLLIPRRLLELYDLFPDHFQSVGLNLPESNNALPDILDEALWSLDFFRRLQTPEGGVRGGVESASHPREGELSWTESLSVMAYAPDVWTSYTYAAVAASAAYTLGSMDAKLAQTYGRSAIKAMEYAEANFVASDYSEGPRAHRVADERNLAALELYRLTKNQRWHDLFLATTAFIAPDTEAMVFGVRNQMDAAFLYTQLAQRASTDSDLAVEKTVVDNAKKAFLQQVNQQVALTKTTGFGWSKVLPNLPLGWRNGLGGPKGVDILRAYRITQDEDYLEAALRATQFALGANPDNMVFTTGMGDRAPQHPLIVDYRLTGQPAPPGITLFGPADFAFHSDYWLLDIIAKDTFPAPRKWPSVENYFDVYKYPMGAEFTVDHMAESAYIWGYLAAR